MLRFLQRFLQSTPSSLRKPLGAVDRLSIRSRETCPKQEGLMDQDQPGEGGPPGPPITDPPAPASYRPSSSAPFTHRSDGSRPPGAGARRFAARPSPSPARAPHRPARRQHRARARRLSARSSVAASRAASSPALDNNNSTTVVTCEPRRHLGGARPSTVLTKPGDIRSILAKVEPPVVRIDVTTQPDSGESKSGTGTGFIVSSDGVIVTNAHVADAETASGEATRRHARRRRLRARPAGR